MFVCFVFQSIPITVNRKTIIIKERENLKNKNFFKEFLSSACSREILRMESVFSRVETVAYRGDHEILVVSIRTTTVRAVCVCIYMSVCVCGAHVNVRVCCAPACVRVRVCAFVCVRLYVFVLHVCMYVSVRVRACVYFILFYIVFNIVLVFSFILVIILGYAPIMESHFYKNIP